MALPLLGAAFPQPRERAAAIGAFGATMAAATAVGPLVGGYLVEGPGWRWIFLVNVPIGVAALAAGRLRLRESLAPTARKIDISGAVLLTSGLFALLLAIIRGNDEGWGSPLILSLFAIGAALLAALFVRQAQTAEPILDLALLAQPSFLGLAVAALSLAEPSRTGMATGTVNTMRQAGVAVLGAIFQRRVTDSMTSRLAATTLPHDTINTLSKAIGSGAGVRAATTLPDAATRQHVAEAARAATSSGLNDILHIGSITAAVCALIALATIGRTPATNTVPQNADGNRSRCERIDLT